MDHPVPPPQDDAPVVTSVRAMFLTLFAEPVGYVILIVIAGLLLGRAPWTFSAADVVFWACAVAIPFAQRHVAAHYMARGGGSRRFGAKLAGNLLAALALWLLAQSLRLW